MNAVIIKKEDPVKAGRILIVDDEDSIRTTLTDYLSLKGYYVDTAEDGIMAIEKLENYEFDIVLTDLKMPNLDGRELMKQMSEKFPGIPKIVLTGVSNKDDIILALKNGAYDFLLKPIHDLEILSHTIERAIEKKKLNDDRNRYITQLKHFNDITTMLNRGKETDEILKTLNTTLKKIIPYNLLALFMIDDDEHVYIKSIMSDRAISFNTDERFPLDEFIPEDIGVNNGILLVNNIKSHISDHIKSKSLQAFIRESIKSYLSLPIIIDGKTRGFLVIASLSTDFFKDEYISFIQSLAGQISISIQKCELINELQLHTQKLERLVKLRTSEVINTQKTTIFALSSLTDARDSETGKHLNRIRRYCVLIAQILKYTGNNVQIENQYIRDLYDSSILHDIGKVAIPDSILLKPGRLTTEEFDIIKTHTIIGYNALREASKDLGDDSFLKMAMDVTLYHHEQWDGHGYPEGLKGEEIPLAARIVAIGDVYDALTSKRPYKKAFTHKKAIKIMNDEKKRFDPQLFKIFIENEDEFDRIRKEI